MGVKTALITGSSRGIGLGLVKAFHAQGYKVIATCRNPSEAVELQALVSELGLPAPIALEITQDQSIQSTFDVIKADYGTIDVLVNNAGIATSNHPNDPPGSMERVEMERVFSTNVISVAMFTQTFLPIIQGGTEKEGDCVPGKILYISSFLGSIACNVPKETNFYMATTYRCSKSALNQLVKSFSVSEGFTALHLAISPGHVNTDMGSTQGRKPPLTVEEVAPKIAKLTDYLTKETNGAFVDYEGQVLPY
eukprot:maker-scaffold145_size311916-snap-gene-2.25 protein:Tk09183 transcript:maker-scaffold145_size311916-snap-gene-2.25-mRNA-1 annotation:"short chain oxidoreductase"